MVESRANPQRFDPYKNYRFVVKVNGRYVAGVSKVSGLKRTTDVVTHRDPDDSSTTRRSRYAAITLERGLTHDREFEQWANSASNSATKGSPGDVRKEIVIEEYDEAGRLSIAYTVFGSWVSEFQAVPDLDAGSSAVTIQQIKLENEGWQSDSEATEPARQV